MDIKRRAALLVSIATLLVLGAGSVASAQSYAIGAGFGVGTDLGGDFDVGNLDERLIEAQIGVFLEPDVLLRLRAGRLDVERSGEPGGKFEKVGVDVEYQFRDIAWTSGLFVGGEWLSPSGDEEPGPPWDDGQDHFGYYGGVNAWFELAPDFYVVPELRFERLQTDDPFTVGLLTASVVYRF